MASLLELSHELLHCIFTEISPTDLSSISRTCKDLNRYVRGNKLLHKDIYRRRYDPPDSELDWETQVHSLFELERILESEDHEVKREALGTVAERIDHLLETSASDPDASLNIRLLAEHFADVANIDVFLCSSSLFSRAGSISQIPAATEELCQTSAKLHCLYGVPVDEVPAPTPFFEWQPHVQFSSPSRTRSGSKPRLTHTYARSKVYDLRQYTDATLWGPFRDDGSQRVDWEKVEAIMIVLGFNLRKFTERSGGRFPLIWDEPFIGATPRSYISLPPAPAPDKELDEELLKIRELALGLDAQDPYGVTGTWMRVVCFLDFNDLYAFNFTKRTPANEPREPINTEEAIRLIRVKWHVTKIEMPNSRGENDDDEDEDDGLDWSNFQGERLPIVHFAGTSRSLHASWDPNANSKIRGTVRQTPEGQIRWTTFSIFHGEERWRSEGIQVGGLRSARGVLGNWFDKDYDIHGPAGPTAFWKETDTLEEENNNSTPLADL